MQTKFFPSFCEAVKSGGKPLQQKFRAGRPLGGSCVEPRLQLSLALDSGWQGGGGIILLALALDTQYCLLYETLIKNIVCRWRSRSPECRRVDVWRLQQEISNPATGEIHPTQGDRLSETGEHYHVILLLSLVLILATLLRYCPTFSWP